MNHRFKVGDPVLIVGCYAEGAQNIGRCAEVMEVIEPEPCDDLCIRVACEGMTFVYGDQSGVVPFLWMAPHHLMPLRGMFKPEIQKQSEASQ